MARLILHPLAARFINELPETIRAEVAEALAYLRRHGRAAQLPDVRPIVTVPNLYETRTQQTIGRRRYTIRVLVMIHDDDQHIACVAGDKDRWSREHPHVDWYSTWLPIAEAVYDKMKEQLP